jgi:dihydroxyacetone kinase
MEMGVGIHGEPGRRRVQLASANAIAEEMLGAILEDLAPKPAAECLLLVNGLGGHACDGAVSDGECRAASIGENTGSRSAAT